KHKGKLADFTAKLLKDKKNIPKDRAALVAAYRDALERARKAAPDVLGTMAPELDVVEGELPWRGAAAMFVPPDAATGRRTQLVLNATDLPRRSLLGAEAW